MEPLKGFFIKSEEIGDENFGVYPSSRSIEDHIKNGIVVIDKPSGPSSHQVTGWVRDMFSLKKAGHAGTLDPKVTGVQVVALEKAARIMPAMISSEKEYICIMNVHKNVSMGQVQSVFPKFRGLITQMPPVKSAVKRVKRKRHIYDLEILEKQGREVLFRVKCEAGTYIRTLCVDIGRELGVGASMQQLRRISSGLFTEKQSVNLQDLRDAIELWKGGDEDELRRLVLPVEVGVEGTKKIVVKDTAVNAICNGAPLGVGGVSAIQNGIEKDSVVSVFSLKGELVGLARAQKDFEELKTMQRGVAAKMDRVVMSRDLYPKTW